MGSPAACFSRQPAHRGLRGHWSRSKHLQASADLSPRPKRLQQRELWCVMSALPCAVQHRFEFNFLHCEAPSASCCLRKCISVTSVWDTNLPDGAALKNLLRGAALATLATFLGCFLIFTVPDFLAAQLNRQMPYWFYESEVSQAMHAAACSPLS